MNTSTKKLETRPELSLIGLEMVSPWFNASWFILKIQLIKVIKTNRALIITIFKSVLILSPYYYFSSNIDIFINISYILIFKWDTSSSPVIAKINITISARINTMYSNFSSRCWFRRNNAISFSLPEFYQRFFIGIIYPYEFWPRIMVILCQNLLIALRSTAIALA